MPRRITSVPVYPHLPRWTKVIYEEKRESELIYQIFNANITLSLLAKLVTSKISYYMACIHEKKRDDGSFTFRGIPNEQANMLIMTKASAAILMAFQKDKLESQEVIFSCNTQTKNKIPTYHLEFIFVMRQDDGAKLTVKVNCHLQRCEPSLITANSFEELNARLQNDAENQPGIPTFLRSINNKEYAPINRVWPHNYFQWRGQYHFKPAFRGAGEFKIVGNKLTFCEVKKMGCKNDEIEKQMCDSLFASTFYLKGTQNESHYYFKDIAEFEFNGINLTFKTTEKINSANEADKKASSFLLNASFSASIPDVAPIQTTQSNRSLPSPPEQNIFLERKSIVFNGNTYFLPIKKLENFPYPVQNNNSAAEKTYNRAQQRRERTPYGSYFVQNSVLPTISNNNNNSAAENSSKGLNSVFNKK